MNRRNLALPALLGIVMLAGVPPAEAQDEGSPVRLYMPDGQLRSHPIKVFINRDISEAQKPRLRLTGSHVVTEKHKGEDALRRPMVVARHQEWIEERHGGKMTVTGTLMLFDLSGYPIPFYKAAMRLTPTLVWENNDGQGTTHIAVGASEVYLGNSTGAFLWVFVLVGVLIWLITGLARKASGRALTLLCDTDGSLSLWRTQVAAWTVAIGGVVAGYGFIRLQVPGIPESLVALMGMSLGTGGISHYQSRKRKQAPDSRVTPMLADLLCDILPDGSRELSLSRTQMLFWTILVLAIFLVKSAMDGEAWNVPWELVALMGISQAGYLTPKLKP